MKLDKIRFARLIGFLERVHALNLNQDDVELIDELIDIDMPAAPTMNVADLHKLMELMQQGTQKVEAIKHYRLMTNCWLKESKDIIEKYWPDTTQKYTKEQLYQLINNVPPTIDKDSHMTLSKFISNLN